MINNRLIIGLVMLSSWMISSCAANQGYSVIATSATTLGVNVSQEPTSGGMSGTLGYKRGEFAFVPTNRNGGKGSHGSTNNGAKDSANVIMEFQYGGWTEGSIYQRLAIGEEAVKNSALMFARNNNGEVDASTRRALQAVNNIKETPSDILNRLDPISKAYINIKDNSKKTTEKQEFDKAAQQAGYHDFEDALAHQHEIKSDQLDKIEEYLQEHNLLNQGEKP